MYKNFVGKIITLGLLVLIRATPVFADDDARLEKEYEFRETRKQIMISDARDLLTEKFKEDDLNEVKKSKDYLKKIEAEHYRVFYPMEYWLILYWTNEYRELLNDIKKEKPLYSRRSPLFLALLEKSRENISTLMEQIQKAGEINDEEKKFLQLFFQTIIFASEHDVINPLADDFLLAYPNSKYESYVRKNIRFKYTPGNFGAAMELFSGYHWFTGKLNKSFTNGIPLGFSFDLAYKRLEIYFRLGAGFFIETKREIEDDDHEMYEGDMREISLDVSLGSAVFENKRLKLVPFVGLGMLAVAAFEEEDQKRGVTTGTALTYLAGFDLNIKFERTSDFWSTKPGYEFIRIRSLSESVRDIVFCNFQIKNTPEGKSFLISVLDFSGERLLEIIESKYNHADISCFLFLLLPNSALLRFPNL